MFDGPYTANDTPAIRARVRRDLDRIVERVARADGHLRALVLCGGFARGEGTVRDGRPVNDYDLVAVRGRLSGRAPYRALEHDLTAELGIHVDLLPVGTAWLRRAPPKLFWLDVAWTGRVVAGDPRALRLLPPMRPADLPPLEVARLLGNRAAGLLREPPDALDVELQPAKAVIAAMDAALLHEGRYAASLRERLEMSRAHPDAQLFARAVAWKLHEGAPPVGWDEARDALLRAVGATGARAVGDGLAERAVHLLRARRLALHPSRAVRRAAWDALARRPGPAAWAEERRAFFERRARTLQ